MPELLFGIASATTPEHAFKSAPKTPSHLHDITNLEQSNNQFTPRTKGDGSLTPELDNENLVRAPCKQNLSLEDTHKAVKLQKRQLKFENGVSLQSIRSSKEKECSGDEVNSNPFCDEKENNFVPLIPQRSRNKATRDVSNGRKRYDNEHPVSSNSMQNNTYMSHITPQKKNMPLLHGGNVTLESPDPMSKYNSSNQTASDLQKVAQKPIGTGTRMAVMLQQCKQDSSNSLHCSSNSSVQVPRLDMKSVESLKTIRQAAAKFVSCESQLQLQGKGGSDSSPDAITDDIYDFRIKREQSHYKQAVDSCKYPMSRDMSRFDVTPPLQKMTDDEEEQLTARVHAVRHKSVRVVEKSMTRRSLSPSLSALERQLQGQCTDSVGAGGLPSSRSLDTLHPHTPNSGQSGQPIMFKPMPPSHSPAGGQGGRSSFMRKSLSPKSNPDTNTAFAFASTPPSSKDKDSEVSVRQARGRRYMNPVSPVVEETKEDMHSPLAIHLQRPMPSRLELNAHRRGPQPHSQPQHRSPPCHSSTIQVEYCIKSPPVTETETETEHVEETDVEEDIHITALSPSADIPHPVLLRKKGARTVTVSGFSKKLLVSLITAAGKKRRRRSKNQPAYTMMLECIPEESCIVFTFPKWISKACNSSGVQHGPAMRGDELSKVVQRSTERTVVDMEYLEWLRSQVVVVNEDEEEEDVGGGSGRERSKLDCLMRSIQTQDNEQFKTLLNENKNLIYSRDHNGNTALVAATMFGWKRGIKNLIKRGADLDAQNRFGNTSLHYASAIEEHHEIKRYLLRKKASSTIRNERGVCSCSAM